MQQQMKIGVLEYYLVRHLRRAAAAVKFNVSRFWKGRITGRWWCEGCQTYHPGRVIGFYICAAADGVCSKHITPERAEKCEAILLGGYRGRSVSEPVLASLRVMESRQEANSAIQEATAEEISAAAAVFKRICTARNADDACKACPIRTMCGAEPYTWEV